MPYVTAVPLEVPPADADLHLPVAESVPDSDLLVAVVVSGSRGAVPAEIASTQASSFSRYFRSCLLCCGSDEAPADRQGVVRQSVANVPVATPLSTDPVARPNVRAGTFGLRVSHRGGSRFLRPQVPSADPNGLSVTRSAFQMVHV